MLQCERERLSSFLLALLNRSASFPHRVGWPFLFSWLLFHLQKAEVGSLAGRLFASLCPLRQFANFSRYFSLGDSGTL